MALPFAIQTGVQWRDAAGRFSSPPVKERLHALLEDQGTRALRLVQEGTPVRTGRARAGWRLDWVPSQLQATLTNDVFYVEYLITGTSRMEPSETLNRALDEVEGDVEQAFQQAGSDILIKLTGGL